MGPILVRHYCGVVNQLVWMLDGWRRNDEKRTSWMPAWISVRFDSTVDYCSRYKSLLYCIVVGLSSAWHVNDVMIRCEKFQLYWRHSLALSDVILRNTHTLHWLPVRKKMDFKIATFVYRSLSGMAPAYWPLCHLSSKEGRRQLRSADTGTCVVRRSYSDQTNVSRLPVTETWSHGNGYRLRTVYAIATWLDLEFFFPHSTFVYYASQQILDI